MTNKEYTKTLNTINLLVNTIKCNASTRGEKEGAEIAICNQVRKIMSNLGYDRNEVSNMLTCGQSRVFFEDGFVKSFNEVTAGNMEHILNEVEVEYVRFGLQFHMVK